VCTLVSASRVFVCVCVRLAFEKEILLNGPKKKYEKIG